MDGTNNGGHPPPAWFPDPSGRPGWRWWAGDHWSEHYAPLYATPGAGEQRAVPAAAFQQARQARLDGFIAVAPWIWVIGSIATLLVNWATIGYYKSLWHWWHRLLHASSAGQTLPAAPQRPLWSSLFSLVGLGIFAVEIVFLVWQFRAAHTARALRYPARHSPGWGVGCWFVPVVNLWMPYQAIRDCLPVGHPGRRYMLYMWITYLCVAVLIPATVVALVGAPDLGIGLVGVSVVAELVLGLNAYRTVTAIAVDHRRAVSVTGPLT